jgi:FMN phosphatase YigB (HAD superfamily)
LKENYFISSLAILYLIWNVNENVVMPLTIEQYVSDYLPARKLPWPAAPKPVHIKAKPHLQKLSVKAVLWNVYGTLLVISGGELKHESDNDFIMEAAFDKTLQEFKMWQSMSRKPGAPAAQLKEMYFKALTHLRMAGSGGERYPEVSSERIWEDIVKKLLQKDYQIDVATYGAMNEFVIKIAYFFHASIQGYGAYPGVADTLELLGERGCIQGLLSDGQAFTSAQIQQAIRSERLGFELNRYIPLSHRYLSFEQRARKPSDTLFKAAADGLASIGLKPADVLHIGSNLLRDIAPAKRIGFRTALFAGDRNSLSATPDQLQDPSLRPDVLITELPQLAEVIG